MIKAIPSENYERLRRQNLGPRVWEVKRRKNGWNYAEAAKAHNISVREWAMLECGATPDQLAAGRYKIKTGRKKQH